MANASADAYTRRLRAAEMQASIEATLKRIATHKGVIGYIVLNPRDGSVMKYVGMTEAELVSKYAKSVHAFVNLTRSVVRSLDPLNDLTFLRVRSKKHEILVAPEKDFTFLVVQDYHLTNLDDMVVLRPKATKKVDENDQPVEVQFESLEAETE